MVFIKFDFIAAILPLATEFSPDANLLELMEYFYQAPVSQYFSQKIQCNCVCLIVSPLTGVNLCIVLTVS